ncbi:RagB/SusD family nutrient uptake outer membrane protein [Pedobacter nyackensis]|uniref:SusD family protein n=1 Tax=Pedobacter nyackensis TaxID=475255 RepID=A0A1W2CSA5_9SPHI|nr:RagB/SusD family nutrient uptake outer membrane protein [Pedobacter nyackensis]SMC88100.1 SusD family protein [Pedobacter nyackensis]
MRNRLIVGLMTIVVMLSVSSCKKWLDVQPRTKIKSDVLLQTEQGYKDALIGCYTLMKSQSLYGRELTFGFMDAVAQQYDTFNNSTYGSVAQFRYTTDAKVRIQIDGMWRGMYNILANVNNILDNIDNNKALFTGNNYQIIKGEALAIRAFIHLDLLRNFASTDLTKIAIPYANSLSTEVTPRSTGNQVMDLLLKDLEDAVLNLNVDPIKKGIKRSATDEFLNNRHQRLNYFAVKGIAARAYLWKNDKVNALTNAMEVIQAGNQVFPWIQTSNISATADMDKDFTFSTENLFALNVFDLKIIANKWFISAFSGDQLLKSSFNYESMYEKGGIGANDYRLIYTSRLSGNNYILYKFFQPDNYKIAYASMIPLVRRSEMNYIAAECNVGLDNGKAIDLLNEVREHRGITTPLSASLTDAQVKAEILKEYRKEFQGEGQLFGYCKRTKQAKFPPNSVTLTDVQLVLPMPENEIEFGK